MIPISWEWRNQWEKLSLKNQFSPSIRNENHVDILYLPRCNGGHRHPETFRRRKVQSRRLLCDNCELTAFKAELCVLLRRENEKLNGGRVSGRVDVRGMCFQERKRKRERRAREGRTERETHHQQLDLVNQRGRCKELVDGRQYSPFQCGSVSDVSSSRASGPDVRPLTGTGQQLLAVARPELPLLQLFPRALVAPFVSYAPPHPQQSRSARVGIRTGHRLVDPRYLQALRAFSELYFVLILLSSAISSRVENRKLSDYASWKLSRLLSRATSALAWYQWSLVPVLIGDESIINWY